MRIFGSFRKPTKATSDLFEAARRESDTESHFGDTYMPPETFQALADRITALDRRVDWLTILTDSASGRLAGSVKIKHLCRLRPFENHAHEGLVFCTTLIPMPPSDSTKVIAEMIQEMNGIMYLSTGSTVVSESGKIHFLTMTLKEPSGFTDPKLMTLVNMNLVIGDEVLRALITVHQRQISASGAIQSFAAAFQEFMDELPSEVLTDYYARVASPPEQGQLVSFRIVRSPSER